MPDLCITCGGTPHCAPVIRSRQRRWATVAAGSGALCNGETLRGAGLQPASPQLLTIPRSGLKAIRSGHKNVFAVHVLQITGGRFYDIGLARMLTAENRAAP